MKGVLWNCGLWLQSIGISDAEPPPSPLFFCSCREIFSFAVILWNPTPCKAVAEEGSENGCCTSQEHRKYPLKDSSVSPCVNIPGVHTRGCQHLYGLWMKSSLFRAGHSSLATTELSRHSRAAALLFLLTRKKESSSLATERFMTCDFNFYLNPENRTGLILNSQETAAAAEGGGAGGHQLSIGKSFPFFPPQSLLLRDLQLLLLLAPSFGERHGPKQCPPEGCGIHERSVLCCSQGCCSAAVLLTGQRSQELQSQAPAES